MSCSAAAFCSSMSQILATKTSVLTSQAPPSRLGSRESPALWALKPYSRQSKYVVGSDLESASDQSHVFEHGHELYSNKLGSIAWIGISDLT